MAWLESIAILLLLGASVAALGPLTRAGKLWIGVWLGCLALLLCLGWLRRHPENEFLPVLGWLTAGRTEYVLYGPLAVLLLGLPGSQLPRRPSRWAVAVLGLVVCLEYCLGPFLGPALQRPSPAVIDPEGICIQTDSYSCGPAASVTALGRLGIKADFLQLATAAHTSQAIGTPPDLLCSALESLYPVRAQYRSYANLRDLPQGQLLVVLELGLFVDHYMALLEMTPDRMILGDPMQGKISLSHSEFEQRWRHVAIQITPR